MRVHYLQHVPFEGLGYLETWLRDGGHRVTATRLFAADRLPNPDAFDWLIVLGGPMGANDEAKFDWIEPEKRLIRDCIGAGKRVLGICLGAQLIAAAMNARVFKNANREIGWFDVKAERSADVQTGSIKLPDHFLAFHWHGDTFDLPKGAVHLASSEACQNQAFAIGEHVLALQFHLETTESSTVALNEHCRGELTADRFVQSADSIMSLPDRFAAINLTMSRLLSGWLAR
jgi:GMP synthase-like glutamine amidotransferase